VNKITEYTEGESKSPNKGKRERERERRGEDGDKDFVKDFENICTLYKSEYIKV